MHEVIGEFHFLAGEWWEHDWYEKRWFWIAGEYYDPQIRA